MAAEAHACRQSVASLNWLLAIKVVTLLTAVTLLRSAYGKKIAAIFCCTGLIV